MSNNLLVRARTGLDRNMETLISDLRHHYSAQPNAPSAPLSQALLFQAMSNHHNNNNNNQQARYQQQVSPSLGHSNHVANQHPIHQAQQQPQQQAEEQKPRLQATISSASHLSRARALIQCAPLDLSVKTRSVGDCLQRPRTATKCHFRNRQHLSLDLLKTIAVMIQDNPTSFNQKSPFDSNHDRNQQTKLIPSSISPISEDENNNNNNRIEQVPRRTTSAPCRRATMDEDGEEQDDDEVAAATTAVSEQSDEIARRLATSADVISSTNGRRPRRQTGNTKRQKANKSHLCNHCGRSFVRSDMLTRHSRLHSGLKPYQCGKCFQVFSRSDHLSTHERTHTGEKPYQCGICSYSACRRDMITRHMRTHLGQRIKRSSADDLSETKGHTEPHQHQVSGLQSSSNTGNSTSNETNSNAQSPASIATVMADDLADEEDTKNGLNSFLYQDTRTL